MFCSGIKAPLNSLFKISLGSAQLQYYNSVAQNLLMTWGWKNTVIVRRIYGVLVHIALDADFPEPGFISCLAVDDLQVL